MREVFSAQLMAIRMKLLMKKSGRSLVERERKQIMFSMRTTSIIIDKYYHVDK